MGDGLKKDSLWFVDLGIYLIASLTTFWWDEVSIDIMKILFFSFQPTQNLSRLTKFITNPVRQTAQCIVVELQMAYRKNFYKKHFHILVAFRRLGSLRTRDTHLYGKFCGCCWIVNPQFLRSEKQNVRQKLTLANINISQYAV